MFLSIGINMEIKTNNRITELDALRGIAAVSVLLFHYTSLYRKEFGLDFSENWDWTYGHHGVQLFFVISGFVIFMSLHHVKSVSEFFFKRFIRLYPTYWACLLITIIFCVVFDYQKVDLSWEVIIFNISMFQSVFHVANIDGSYWSLLPELLFYIVMAVVYHLKILSKIKIIAIIWILLMLLSTFRPSVLDVLLNLRFGMFFIAGIMFYRIRFEKSNILEHLMILACLFSVYFVRKDVEYLLASAVIFIIFYLFIYGKLSFLNKKILLFLGYISYPLYLLHQNIGFILINKLKSFGVHEVVAIGFAFAVMVVMAWFVVDYIEKPILKVVKKIKINSVSNNKLFSKP